MDRLSGIDRETLARHIGADVDRAAVLLARILLIRVVRRIVDGSGRGPVRSADSMISDGEGAGEFAVAGATTRQLARVLAPAHDIDRDLTTAIAAVERLDRSVRSAESAYSDYRLATDPDNGYIDQERGEVTWMRWQQSRRRVGPAIGGLPTDLGDGKVGSLLLDRAIDRVFKPSWNYWIRYVFAAEARHLWRRRVAGVLLDATRAGPARGRRAATRSLADDVRDGRRALIEGMSSPWARHAASQLEEIAVPVFAGQEPPAAGKATAIRLGALCLAHEAEAARITLAAEAFHGIVVGITLMEQDSTAASEQRRHR